MLRKATLHLQGSPISANQTSTCEHAASRRLLCPGLGLETAHPEDEPSRVSRCLFFRNALAVKESSC